MSRVSSISALACVVMLSANVLLVLMSWILSAVGTDDVRSMISGEGVRWFFGHYVDIITSPVLVWLLLLSVSYSCFCGSGLREGFLILIKREKLVFKQRLGFRVILILLLIQISITAWLVSAPHAVLASPVGSIFPSPFSTGIIPAFAGTVTLLSFVYGLVNGTIQNVDAAFKCLYFKMPVLAPLFIVYIFASQLFACISFVFPTFGIFIS